MRLLLILASIGAAALDGPNPAIEGPVFDKEGHYVAYNYADGTHDWYTYDDKWRLVLFEARDGTLTRYVYKPDGKMEVETFPAKAAKKK